MRLLRVHTDSAAEELDGALARAIERFNRGLDVRLRFLSIGIEDRVLYVGSSDEALEGVASAIDEHDPELILLVGSGRAAVAAASTAARLHRRVVRLGAGERDDAHADEDRAVDRIAAFHLCRTDAAAARLVEEELGDRILRVDAESLDALGDRVVDALSRARRTVQGDA